MSHSYTLGIDFGGSSSKASLLEDTGRVVATASREYPSYFPNPGWFEQDADELFETLLIIIREILSRSGIDPAEIRAVGVDAATHMAVLCDADDRPLRRFIHWSDTRSSAQAQYLNEHYGALLSENSVNTISAAWTLPHLLWLQENEPEILSKTRRLYFLKDYLRSRMTGDFCTDSVEVMGSFLSNDFTSDYSDELCAIAGLSPDRLPEIKDPTDLAGTVSPGFAASSGLKSGTPVIVGATDTAMEVYASGAIETGTATVKLATAGRICPITTGPVPSRQFFNYRHIVPGKWYPGTGTRTCAASYKWYRDLFGGPESVLAASSGVSTYDILNQAAAEVPAGSDNLFYHPFLFGEMTPYYNDNLCASFTGIRASHTKGHFTRAVLEGVSYSMRDCLEEIKAQNIRIDRYNLIGGGAKGALWRQILCDVLNTPLVCTMENDSSLGTAMLAAVATGIFGSFEESVSKCVVVSHTVTPIEEHVKVYEKGFGVYRDIVRALSGIYDRL